MQVFIPAIFEWQEWIPAIQIAYSPLLYRSLELKTIVVVSIVPRNQQLRGTKEWIPAIQIAYSSNASQCFLLIHQSDSKLEQTKLP